MKFVGVAKLDRQKLSPRVTHVMSKVETKIYGVNNHVENI